jgi:GxxExxY protein
MAELVYPKESYELNKIFFEVQNDLGTKFQEKHYSRAIEAKLIENKIPYQKEVLIEVHYHGQLLGKFFADFIIWNKIIVETKATPINKFEHLKQIKRYLEAKNMRLGILVNFSMRPLKPLRVLNPISIISQH